MAYEEPIPDFIRTEIISRLMKAESEHDVKIVYACESGSRAWGFASPDSDYDVRFIYVRKPEWYCSFDIERQRDVIEYPIVDKIDCNGWDIRKALYLVTRTNGALLEWLNSPIQYIQYGAMAESLRNLAPVCINFRALCYHYSHLAKGNARGYLFNEEVRLKKYFYVLRPLLAIRYVEEFNRIPPIEFEQLVRAVAPFDLRLPIANLLVLKRATAELGVGPAIPEIERFIESELQRHGVAFSGQGRPESLDRADIRSRLNAVFREAIALCAS